MTRITVTGSDIIKSKIEDLTPAQRAEFYPDLVKYRPKLYKSLQLPSYVHSYSIAIEYMRKWFLDNFKDNYGNEYFKVVHINGKHVLDDWKHFNNYNIKREKPMLSITPTVNTDYDRDTVDMYMGDKGMMLRRSTDQQSFFKDYKYMSFIYLQMREMEMNFSFRCRVNSRSEQLDLYNKMELWFRIGQTQQESLSADFHIPYNIILNVAEKAGFEIKDNIIVDLHAFLNYLNMHSYLPIIYKNRAINQKPDFFVRARNLRAHIAIRDKLDRDDGERDGKLDTNFHVEMQAQLHIPIPHFYAYLSQDPIKEYIIPISEQKPTVGLYTIAPNFFPPQNEQGWGTIAMTAYCCDPGDKEIPIYEIFRDKKSPVTEVINECNKLSISPEGFLDIKIRSENYFNKIIRCHTDYNNMKIILEDDVDEEIIYDIIIYGDGTFINEFLSNINNYNESRINKENYQ